MPFIDWEGSNYLGEPVMLYEFKRGGIRLLYANADRDITAGVDTFGAQPISDDGSKQKGDAVTDAFNIVVPTGIGISEWFAYTPPSDLVYVIVRRFHYGEPEAVVVWIGTVVGATWDADDKVTLACQAASVSLKRGGLRMAWQRGCPHALYDQNCRADKESYRFDASIIAINTNSGALSLNGTPPLSAHWAGGTIEFDVVSGTVERRLINNVGFGVVLPYGNLDGYFVGQSIRLYPGCLRTSFWCDSFFHNIENYGGFPFMPNRTPYNGDPVF